MRRTIPLTIGFAVSAMIAAGCSSGATTSPSDASEPIETTAVFSSLGPDFTYDETAVPRVRAPLSTGRSATATRSQS